MDLSSSSASSKRARPPTTTSTRPPSCSVDGCIADLGQCRDYHRRHKVCEFHSKTPKVTISGQELRFCQQCSRFHSLVEFDGQKRSCRKRLDGHNRRRRKSQPCSVTMSAGKFFTSIQGSRYLQFSSPQTFSTITGTSSPWTTTSKQESDATVFNTSTEVNFIKEKPAFIEVASQNHKRESQSQFSSQGSVDSTLFADSTRALSLLSSSQRGRKNQEMGVNHVAQSDGHPIFASLRPGTMEGNSSSGMCINTDIGGLNIFNNFRHESDGSSYGCEPHKKIPFSWG